ncbi:hypothetical protein D3C78_1508090 [compost metagenome]
MPAKPLISQPRSVVPIWRSTGVPLITAPSYLMVAPLAAASWASDCCASAIGPLLVVITCLPWLSAARQCDSAGSPVCGSVKVASITTST